IVLISSGVFPAILRRMPFMDASLQKLVRSSPLYPSVRFAKASMSTSLATSMSLRLIRISSRRPSSNGRGM
ncbi:hypothetical protein M758_10G074900, partial [Ceratodon purpureus]